MHTGLQRILDQAVNGGEIAGANLLVIQNGRQVAYVQSGIAAAGRSFDRDTICRIYSMTKPVTAVAAMLLMERGQLDLASSVGQFIPEFQNPQVWENGKKVPARRNILIKDLLSMTSGISYPGMDESGQEVARVFEELDSRLYGSDPMTTQEWAAKMGKCGLAFHPGDQWMYGSSADVLGAVIEKVSGMTLANFMKREIFEPLGMEDTDFWVPSEKQHRLADVYEWTETGVRPWVTNNLGICCPMDRNPAFQSGGAGLASTVDDYGKLAQSLLGHGKQILKPETVRYMTQARLLPWQETSCWRSWESMPGYTYGNLCRILAEPGMAVLNGWKGEYGWDGWLGTYFCNSPEQDVTVLLFTQRRDAGTLEVTRKVRNYLTAQL